MKPDFDIHAFQTYNQALKRIYSILALRRLIVMYCASGKSIPGFQTVFVDENPEVVNALAESFGRSWPDSVRFVVGNVLSSGPKIIVTPTNCEGDMSAGLDLQLRILFPNIEEHLQNYAHSLPPKRLKIGTTFGLKLVNPIFLS